MQSSIDDWINQTQPFCWSIVNRGCAMLSAIEEGYEVFVVTDASVTFNQTTRDAAWARMQAAGVQLMSWFGMACELHRDWRNDLEGLGTLFSNHLPAYRNLTTSYNAPKQ